MEHCIRGPKDLMDNFHYVAFVKKIFKKRERETILKKITEATKHLTKGKKKFSSNLEHFH